MPNPNHHLCVHGHFYQPPRGNPWLGVIEAQPSAAPFHDWNDRITHECYARLARSVLRDEAGKIEDLYNCYAQMSFNIGPTLLEWLQHHHPDLCRHIVTGERLGAQQRGGHPPAMAQVYNHVILPLADARDRHTQIRWGLREFEHRFERPARGMWLSECAIDMNTIRALIDHGIRYVILSPYQASAVRPFGQDSWKSVADGSIDTRHPYRVFEVDGAGHTHFDRWIDVVFYNPTLSTRISFEHLLKDPDLLEAQIREHFDEEATLPQLVTIATDGEIYGHHEPDGETTLSALFARVAPRQQLYISNIEQYLAENPPCWEAYLWNGEDGRGTSWSCPHGVGRWYRHCGCSTGGPGHWSQAWRTPLRDAFDALRQRVKTLFEQHATPLLRDPWDARDDYISVLLDPSPRNRTAFLERHARKALHSEERIRIWRLLEASANAMYMYTSCGWFFADVAGIEPVQNMRYALRAAELVQPYTDEDLTSLLESQFARAESNMGGTGADVFKREVQPTRYTPDIIAANHALKRMLELPEPEDIYEVTIEKENRKELKHGVKAWGRLSFSDPRTMETYEFKFYALTLSATTTGAVIVPADQKAFFRRMHALSADALAETIRSEGIPINRLPDCDREQIIYGLMRETTQKQEKDIRAVYDRSVQFLTVLAQNRLPVPSTVRVCAEHVMEKRFLSILQTIFAAGACADDDRARLQAVNDEAETRGIRIHRDEARRLMNRHLGQTLRELCEHSTAEGVKTIRDLTELCAEAGLRPDDAFPLQAAFWRYIAEAAPRDLVELGQRDEAARLRQLEDLQAIGERLGFAHSVLDHVR